MAPYKVSQESELAEVTDIEGVDVLHRQSVCSVIVPDQQ
jgi:hypothetical protein